MARTPATGPFAGRSSCFNGSAADRRRRGARPPARRRHDREASTGPPLIGDGEENAENGGLPAMNGEAGIKATRDEMASLLQRVRR